jgi:hypothetical protein
MMRDRDRSTPAIEFDRDDFVELQFKPETKGLGAADGCRFWIKLDQLDELIANGGHLEKQDLLEGLLDWLRVTDDPLPALDSLRHLMAESMDE